jgi:menaquinol-cytochrome c reductase cytochrome b/c subunit
VKFMTTKVPTQASFSKSSKKTYTLVELVSGAPTVMTNHGPDDTIFAFPIVAILEVLLSLGVGALLLFISLSLNAPLEEIANPNQTTDPAKAPWYFMGLQEMLEHGHPTLMAVALPTLMVIFILAIPYIDHSRKGAGRWFTSPRGLRITRNTAIYALIVMPTYILMDNFFPPRELLRGVAPDFVAQVIIPALILGSIVLLPLFVLRRSNPTAREVVLTLFTMLFVSAIIFTLTGFLFRGPGFDLYLPWNMPGGYSPFDNL